jgi:hypothetical protein
MKVRKKDVRKFSNYGRRRIKDGGIVGGGVRSNHNSAIRFDAVKVVAIIIIVGIFVEVTWNNTMHEIVFQYILFLGQKLTSSDDWFVEQYSMRNDDLYIDDDKINADTITQKLKRKQRDPLAIFYNIFIPSDNETKSTSAVRIVQEQIGQVARSAAAKYRVTLYYNIIGNSDPLLINDWMTKKCQSLNPNLICQLNNVYEVAEENVTLESLHTFCINHPNYRVSYLHSKGTFHSNKKNTHWRRSLTDGALAEGCINPPNSSCNVCGLQFFTQFTFFIPGNMFSAHCSYVRKLLPLSQYKKKQEEAIMNILLLRLRNQLRSSLLWDQPDFFGLDRYSNEHWIGSHPDIVPCDMDPIGSVYDVFTGKTSFNDFKWGMGPRNSGIAWADNINFTARQEKLYSTQSLRHREILLLPGNLVKWWTLYGEFPNAKSWVWDYFPDGDLWREAVSTYGGAAVELLTKRYMVSLDGSTLQSSFAPLNDFNTNTTTEKYLSPMFRIDDRDRIGLAKFSTVALFYHIAIPNGWDLQESLSIVASQLKIIGTSDVTTMRSYPVPLYFTIAGSSATSKKSHNLLLTQVTNFCHDTRTTIDCRQLPSFDQNYEGETIRQLYQYCRLNPSHRVSYLHNQGPVQLRSGKGNKNLIRHLTMAVTSLGCLKPPDDTCNVCGLIFHMLWAFYFPGNMFAASCSYVNSLIPPNENFEKRWNEFVGLALLTRIRGIFQTNLFEDRIDYSGLDHYAMDFWIGSHPTFQPCDLSGSSSKSDQAGYNHTNMRRGYDYWRSANRDVKDFNWELTPDRVESPWQYDATKMVKIERNESLLRREYYLLPGNIQRWLFLYDDIPSADSWIWKAMPDGRTWLEGYREYGADVVNKLTKKYVDDKF